MDQQDDRNLALKALLEELDIPPGGYERAEARYHHLGKFFGEASSECAGYDPHIFPQGSFRLGTVIRPLDPSMEYDLDLSCVLRSNVTKQTHSQEMLKAMIGRDLENYRKVVGIYQPLCEKRCCWRLQYQDQLNFHMDVVPAIPEAATTWLQIRSRMGSIDPSLADYATAITDNESAQYQQRNAAWLVSNTEGYAHWFTLCMRRATFINERLMQWSVEAKTDVDDLPVFRLESPLQQAVRILKRHRDVMFQDEPDAKPISIIITTLAGLAYQGEPDLLSTLDGLTRRMPTLIRATAPHVPNPVNPSEDFADKWYDPNYAEYRLEHNCRLWLKAARASVEQFLVANRVTFVDIAKHKFDAVLSEQRLSHLLSNATASTSKAPVVLTSSTAKPWHDGYR